MQYLCNTYYIVFTVSYLHVYMQYVISLYTLTVKVHYMGKILFLNICKCLFSFVNILKISYFIAVHSGIAFSSKKTYRLEQLSHRDALNISKCLFSWVNIFFSKSSNFIAMHSGTAFSTRNTYRLEQRSHHAHRKL